MEKWIKTPFAGGFWWTIENTRYGEADPVIWGPSFKTEGDESIYSDLYYVWKNHRQGRLDWNSKRYPKDYAIHGLKTEWATKHVGMFPTIEEAIEFAESLRNTN